MAQERLKIFVLFLTLGVVTATQEKLDCTKVYCPSAIPAHCPDGSSWEKPHSACCNCCVKNGKCVTLDNPKDCVGIACPLVMPAQCPSGSHWKQPKGGCCDCCVDSNTGGCVDFGETQSSIVCPKRPCVNPLPPGKTCPAGSTLGTINENGCPSCPCCVSHNKCVSPIDVVCPKYFCIRPSDCPDGSQWMNRTNPSTNCVECPCCVNARDQCVDPLDCTDVSCPQVPRNQCPRGTTLKKKGCCQCCENSAGACVNPNPCNIFCTKPPTPDQCQPGSSLQTVGCCPCCFDPVKNGCTQPVDCTLVRCERPPNPNQCPKGTSVQKKSCCACCVDSKQNCVPTTTLLDARTPLALQP